MYPAATPGRKPAESSRMEPAPAGGLSVPRAVCRRARVQHSSAEAAAGQKSPLLSRQRGGRSTRASAAVQMSATVLKSPLSSEHGEWQTLRSGP